MNNLGHEPIWIAKLLFGDGYCLLKSVIHYQIDLNFKVYSALSFCQ